MFRFAAEGYPFIIVFTFITLIVVLSGKLWIATIPFVLTLFMLYFFRDPERVTPEGRRIFYSPADGKVILIEETEERELLNERALEISIFMSPFDVHVNRAPCEGTVKAVKHYPGRFLAAFKKDSSILNEHVTMLLETEHEKIVVRQVAGFLARRIVCRVKPDDLLKQGQRYGLIKFGSRLDVFLPLNTQINVKLNDKVKAGETVLGIIENK
jgi:phosphatidylserine decarboxylase